MKPWVQVIIGILIGLLAAGLIILIAYPDPGIPIELSQPTDATGSQNPAVTPTLTDMLVQIGGQVRHPGVYSLSPYARLGELIDAAGGLTPQADQARVNFAAILEDGDYFYIPEVDETVPESAKNAPSHSDANEGNHIQYPLDLNTASQEELESLPGIGPAKAADIIAYREASGDFTTIEELTNVEGIGEATVDALREYLIITP